MAETHLLRITQNRVGPDKFSVEISYEAPGTARQIATSTVDFRLTDQEHEQIRWYLEDYLQFPQEPAPTIAARIAQRMEEIGKDLFKAIFQSDDDARDLWATIRTKLNDIRVEVVTSIEDATAIPLELIRDPKTDECLALRAVSFVRAHPHGAQPPKLPSLSGEDEAIRILLVICRPGKGDDVPFRSVASRLIKGLTAEIHQQYRLDVLRPATFARLAEVLRKARTEEEPYHIVHFDGHGCYEDLHVLYASQPARNPRGYLLFENPESLNNSEYIHGEMLGELLAKTGVSVLVLNACRSARADPKQTPDSPTEQEAGDPHTKLRAFGSLAQEVIDAGVAGVVAMRYNVYVVTAARFVADLYSALVHGRTFGEAVTIGRKQLAAEPLREIAFEPRPLQDWCVPIVYEAAPIRLFEPRADDDKRKLTVDTGKTPVGSQNLDPTLPRRPDAGFFGRDETLLALDRGFDTQRVVLLHAFAGSGKTATAAEFARWYFTTGGLDGGPVLFTSFEHYTPLHTVLGHFGQMFGPILEQHGINWSALTDIAQMRDLALQVLKQAPVLWIWDNIEPVTGFPAGTKSDWSDDEQKELVDFLWDARDTKARFLLASRRDEQGWLGDLPARIKVPPMPLQERVQLARALADKYGKEFTSVADWRSLLEFTQGNPLTITVLVGQALRSGLQSPQEIEDFVEKLRKGKAEFTDEASQGRSRSLGVALRYGFDAFNEEEQKVLALLHLFQGCVDVCALLLMGNPPVDWSLPELYAYDRDGLIALLERAAEVGLLTAHDVGCYHIHPVLPWFFKDAFDRCYEDRSLDSTRAFAEAMGVLGSYCHAEYENGVRNFLDVLTEEEANLLHARRLALAHGWSGGVMGSMQGLYHLFTQAGRWAEWRMLVEEIVPEFVDPATDGPLPDRENHWYLVTQYRVRLAEEERDWSTAQRLQEISVDWAREQAGALVDQDPENLSNAEFNIVRSLGASLHQLAEIQREQGLAECVDNYKEDFRLAQRMKNHTSAAKCAFNLGNAYSGLSSIRDLAQAEQWYQRSLELHEPRDRLGRSRCIGQLGYVAWERFQDAQAASAKEDVLLEYINDALRYYHQSLDMLPKNAVGDLAVVHHQLGAVHADAGHTDKAREYYRESIRYQERQGNIYGAGIVRHNVALTMLDDGRLADALEYARAALANFQRYGDRAANRVQRARQLIARIEKAMK